MLTPLTLRFSGLVGSGMGRSTPRLGLGRGTRHVKVGSFGPWTTTSNPPFQYLPSPVQIGTGVGCTSFHSPLRVYTRERVTARRVWGGSVPLPVRRGGCRNLDEWTGRSCTGSRRRGVDGDVGRLSHQRSRKGQWSYT